MFAKYRWPTKIKRFGIQDPFLQLIVAKYENEIPWDARIDDERTLSEYIEETMLQRLLAQATFPTNPGSKHFFISPRHVDLDAALGTDIELDQTEIGVVRLIREEDGAEEAVKALVEVVNARKAHAFRQWVDIIGGQFLGSAVFAFLLLKPLFNMAGKGSRRTVLPPSTDVLHWLSRRMSSGRLSPTLRMCSALRNKASTDLGEIQLSRRELTYAGAVGSVRWRSLLVAERHDLDMMPL